MSPRRSAAAVVVVMCAIMALTVGTAAARWSTTGAGTGAATTATLNPPTAVTVAPVDQSTSNMTIGWTNATGTPTPLTYQVVDNGTRTVTCNSNPCIDTGQPAGSSHSYVVTTLYKSAWTSPAGAQTGSTNTKPSLAITSPANNATGVSKTGTISGTTAGGTTPGAITVTVTPTAGGAAIQSGTATITGGSWTYGYTVPSAGTQYTISASQTSSGGTTSATSVSFTTAAATPTVAIGTITATTSNGKGTINGTNAPSGLPVTIDVCPGDVSTLCAAGSREVNGATASAATGTTWTYNYDFGKNTQHTVFASATGATVVFKTWNNGNAST